MQNIFSDNNEIKPEINQRQVTGRSLNTWNFKYISKTIRQEIILKWKKKMLD